LAPEIAKYVLENIAPPRSLPKALSEKLRLAFEMAFER
jgi:hypothetical protein